MVGLRRRYTDVDLVPVLWEDLALPASASFQETIDFLLGTEPIDVAVSILWSRLGSPLGPQVVRADGSLYRSGTEREFDLMLTAFEKSGRKRPGILAYVREDDAGFTRVLAESPTSRLAELVEQQKLAESFVSEQFRDAEGRNLRAYQTYLEPTQFLQRLRIHLRRTFDDLVGFRTTTAWNDEPYPGLEAFDVEHAPIFHGREEETFELVQRLRDKQESGCGFVVIVGANGSGKSSLARAGVAAELLQQEDAGCLSHWQIASLIPRLSDGKFLHSLVCALGGVVPELADSESTISSIVEGLTENPSLTVRLTISRAFSRLEKPMRLLVILDQMEELWTDRNTTHEDRESILATLEALACSGHVSVLATLRSDFYSHAQQSKTFLRLKGDRGHYDLLSPDAASIHRLITEPARLAGLRFERNERSGRSLDELILQDVSEEPNALPLLEYTLSELHRRRDRERRLMTFASYVEIGGVEAAIGKRAEKTLASLPVQSQNALHEILPLLISVDLTGEMSAVRRRANAIELTSTPERKLLTEHLITERFLSTDRQGELPVASLVHEALLHRWNRIANWIDTNRENLRIRVRVEQSQLRWEQEDRNDSLLLPEGVMLEDGRKLSAEESTFLRSSTRDYIDRSLSNHNRRTRRVWQFRIAGLLVLLALTLPFAKRGLEMASSYLARRANADATLETLLTTRLSSFDTAFTAYSRHADDTSQRHLREVYQDAKGRQKMIAAMALVDDDVSVIPFIQQQMLTLEPEDLEDVAAYLREHRDELAVELRPVLESHQFYPTPQFLNAASVASTYDIVIHSFGMKFRRTLSVRSSRKVLFTPLSGRECLNRKLTT